MLNAARCAAARMVSDRDVANQIAPGDFVSHDDCGANDGTN